MLNLETLECSRPVHIVHITNSCTSHSLDFGHDYIEIEVGIRVVKFVIQ
jgi:hypothetical protein